MKTFAGVASLPGRPLEQTLRSLRPQVDEIGVVLNGYGEIPGYVYELADHWMASAHNLGSSAKLMWATSGKPAIYFACDDDLEYPLNYVATLTTELDRWDHGVIVTACGRTLKPDAQQWRDWTGDGRYITEVPEARWINYLGGCAFAFAPAALPGLPDIVPPNEEEAILSVWAQREGIPIRLVQRPYDWPKRIPLQPGAFNLYEEAHRERFATRSRIIQSLGQPWTVHQPAEAPV